MPNEITYTSSVEGVGPSSLACGFFDVQDGQSTHQPLQNPVAAAASPAPIGVFHWGDHIVIRARYGRTSELAEAESCSLRETARDEAVPITTGVASRIHSDKKSSARSPST